MDRAKLHEHYEEKREYPRVVIDSPVNVLCKLNQMEAVIHDISPDGLQIRADTASLKKINPNDEHLTGENAPLLDITFCLKLFEMDMKISALCKMHYFNFLSGEKSANIACGLKFVNFEGDGSSQLEAFFVQEMTIV